MTRVGVRNNALDNSMHVHLVWTRFIISYEEKYVNIILPEFYWMLSHIAHFFKYAPISCMPKGPLCEETILYIEPFFYILTKQTIYYI